MVFWYGVDGIGVALSVSKSDNSMCSERWGGTLGHRVLCSLFEGCWAVRSGVECHSSIAGLDLCFS